LQFVPCGCKYVARATRRFYSWLQDANNVRVEKCRECGFTTIDSKQIIEHFLKTGHQSLINPGRKSV
jgi:hypothetical protein